MSTDNIQQSAMKELIDRYAADLRVSLMAEVLECNVDEMTVVVKPLVNDRKMAEEGRAVEYEEMQAIFNVPLATVSGVQFMPGIGGHGLLVFHDFDLDQYKLSRARSDPSSARNHDYQDAIFIPLESAKFGRPDAYIQLYLGIANIVAPNGIFLNGVEFSTHTHTGNLGSPTGIPQPVVVPPPIEC